VKAIRRCLRRARAHLDRERTQLARANLLANANHCDPSVLAAIRKALLHNVQAKHHISIVARLLLTTNPPIKSRES